MDQYTLIDGLAILSFILGGAIFYSNTSGAYEYGNFRALTFSLERRWLGRLIGTALVVPAIIAAALHL